MSALPLAALETRPIQIPVYRNEQIKSFAKWFAANDKAITEYYNAIRPYCEGEPLVDYWMFAALQHEREEMKLQESDRNQADLKQQLADEDERYMCTCHGIDRVGDACIENCGKVRL